ncbi:hypothetical protein [Sphingosinicella sp. CPCC 101087]|uniref:hypothetical protein n=1 Tax=Sphingosinicella sp. CPCC 101087 TaxID=2497754 RepID=UPI00101CEDE5|nr:hypothetical protein [Sphingosinicella sp. CPCC 101087]
MSALLKQRARIVRVRRLQHDLAASAAAEAAGKVQLLETSRQRLADMRSELNAIPGPTSGSGLARIGELAMRLDVARQGLAPSLDSARAAAAQKERIRLSKRRDQESAEKLQKSAAVAADALAERQTLRTPRLRQRARLSNDGGDQ